MKEITSPDRDDDDLRPEYSREFFKGMKRNRFATEEKEGVSGQVVPSPRDERGEG